MNTERTCSVDGCARPRKSRGYCNMHYQRWRTHGSVDVVLKEHTPNGTLRKFFEEAILVETDDCIVWPYATNVGGYGVLGSGGKRGRQIKVHRLALEQTAGPAPEGKPLACHGPCHNRACFNPRHLYWGSERDNAEDRRRDGTHFVGEQHPAAKMTAEQVADIRDRYARGLANQPQLAAEFGLRQQQISHIVRGKSWSGP